MITNNEIIDNGCSAFTKGTEILMDHLGSDNIEDITTEDSIHGIYGDKLVHMAYTVIEPVVKIELYTGDTVCCSFNTKFLVENDLGYIWTKAIDLQSSMTLTLAAHPDDGYCENIARTEIISISVDHSPTKLYGIAVVNKSPLTIWLNSNHYLITK